MRKLEHILETFPLSSLRRAPEAIYFFLEGKKKGCKSQSSTCIAHRVTVLPIHHSPVSRGILLPEGDIPEHLVTSTRDTRLGRKAVMAVSHALFPRAPGSPRLSK